MSLVVVTGWLSFALYAACIVTGFWSLKHVAHSRTLWAGYYLGMASCFMVVYLLPGYLTSEQYQSFNSERALLWNLFHIINAAGMMFTHIKKILDGNDG
ncbi:hypothetical protein FF098_014895 [Parvularcula flava]|uniref:Uncharacterized protein n=1 Tax=Aquisalinus luteolus TaxID=1566827 RepID=A0A8J3A3C3_9PROT|nr:hypothetical protein [Aquisalinus luteolus]NHK29206.1 hypothetical protein [Aquisalinus luteolus]GGH99972.1 hypothetical protein GCM10011355_27170 [Aquisalinus luteolus]